MLTLLCSAYDKIISYNIDISHTCTALWYKLGPPTLPNVIGEENTVLSAGIEAGPSIIRSVHSTTSLLKLACTTRQNKCVLYLHSMTIVHC